MKVTSKFNIQLEFMLSLYLFELPSFCKKTDLGLKWRKDVSKKLPTEWKDQLKDKELSNTLTWVHSCIHSGYVPGKTVDDLLKWVNQDDDAYRNIDFPKPPYSMKSVYPFLKTWYDHYFSLLDPLLFEQLHKKQEEVKKIIENQDPQKVINNVTKGLLLENLPDDLEVSLIPQYHARPIVMFHCNERHHAYQYSAEEIIGDYETLPPIMFRVQRALSDENRLQILKFIESGPQTFKTIHQFIGLAKSTVHHHLIALRAAGLVNIHVNQGKQDYYTFREQGLSEMEGRLLAYIKDREE
ncbi:ArsR/SmtB family transcription factor [Evansella sp. AB-rgal1]|uniref:ArsR/SmtB family transcription factor n=1 Tax=Evansella sp. AB-rgal1 TaxID=3242696 RepID=UPI00359E615B